MKASATNIHRIASKLLDEARERDRVESLLRELGFTDRTRSVRGFIPHWQRGDDLVFFTNVSYYIGRIVRMKLAYQDYPGKVYVVVTSAAPSLVVRDLLASKLLIPLNTELVPYTWHTANTVCEAPAISPLPQ